MRRVFGRSRRVTARAADRLAAAFWQVPLGPRRFRCPACGLRTRRFAPGGPARRPNARCPRCESLERHRALWLYLREHTPYPNSPVRVLVVSPDRFLEHAGPRQGWDYLSIDLEPGLAMRAMDLTALELPDADRDLLIAYHVLEHIPDDRAAMREIARVLRPDGVAILEVPLRGDETDERFIEGPAEERVRHYGQADHVRLYGHADFVRRLVESGLHPTAVRVGDVLARHVESAALSPDEVFFVVRRAPA